MVQNILKALLFLLLLSPLKTQAIDTSGWVVNMKYWGEKHCAFFNGSHSFDEELNATYYDAQKVFYQIYEYTQDSNYLSCIDSSEAIYRDEYVVSNNGAIPGYWTFTSGLKHDYSFEGDEESKEAIKLINENAAFHPNSTPPEWTSDDTMSREVAYIILNYLDGEAVGLGYNPRITLMVDQALGHIDQWVTKKADYFQPFMGGLTGFALASYNEKYPDPRIVPALKELAHYTFNCCWLRKAKAFKYSTPGSEAAPDLNMLIAPYFAYLWYKTKEPKYRNQFDVIFDGGVVGSYLSNPKQFNQNYWLSFQALKWRN